MIKLSQRDNKIEIGDRFMNLDNNDIVKIIDVDLNAKTCRVKHEKNNEENDLSIYAILNLGVKIQKQHEYSPVNMTGRYTTIGD